MNTTEPMGDMPSNEMPGMDMMMMMYMSFYNSCDLTLLFKGLKSTDDDHPKGNPAKYAGLLAIQVCLVIVMEALGYVRWTMQNKLKADGVEVVPWPTRLSLAFNYLISLTFGYLAMLGVMSFNTGIFIATVGAYAVTNILFTYLKKLYAVKHRRE